MVFSNYLVLHQKNYIQCVFLCSHSVKPGILRGPYQFCLLDSVNKAESSTFKLKLITLGNQGFYKKKGGSFSFLWNRLCLWNASGTKEIN